MMRLDISRITCVADSRLTPRIEAEADRMGLLETYSERGKQTAHKSRPGFLFFRRRPALIDAPTHFIRLYVPRRHERAVMARLAAAADLFLPGRGSLFAEDVTLVGDSFNLWNDKQLSADVPAWVDDARLTPAPYELIFCIVPRGHGDELAHTMLDTGLGVPMVSYGEGMGLRGRLGLLRITIPREKEMLWFLIPPGDADFVVDLAARKAGLREPGRGFLCRIPVRALAVNTRMVLSRRKHVASMEQVISTLDQLRGSADWRRVSATPPPFRPPPHSGPGHYQRFTLVCEEGTAQGPVRAAMHVGAGGATLSRLSRRAPDPYNGNETFAMMSHAREACDLIVPRSLAPPLEQAITNSGFFEPPINGFIEIGLVHDAITYRRD